MEYSGADTVTEYSLYMMPGSKGLNPHELAHQWMKNLGFSPGHTVHPLSFGRTRHDKSTHSVPLVITAPQIFPVGRLTDETVVNVISSQSLCHLGDAIIIVSILHRTISGTVDTIRNITQAVIFYESAPTLFFFVSTTHIPYPITTLPQGNND